MAPALAIETVAAGGGSICRFDGQRLRVGPKSAGASPGPACYGGGGPLTLTDINLLAGRLAPERFGIPIETERARHRLHELCRDRGIALVLATEAQIDPAMLAVVTAFASERKLPLVRGILDADGKPHIDELVTVLAERL